MTTAAPSWTRDHPEAPRRPVSPAKRDRATADDDRRTWERLLKGLSVLVPFFVAVGRAAGSSEWRADLPSVRDFGLVAIGFGGSISTLLTQAISLLPLGPTYFRGALVSAAALAAAAYFLFDLTRNVLRQMAASGGVATVLATLSTLTAALAPSFQREATVGGGAMVVTALALATLSVFVRSLRDADHQSDRLLVLAALSGATFAEAPVLSFGLFGAISASLVVRRLAKAEPLAIAQPLPRLVPSAFVFFTVALLLLLPSIIRPLSPVKWLDLGHVISAERLAGLGTETSHRSALLSWSHEVSAISLAIAAIGLLLTARTRQGRAIVALVLALTVTDAALPSRNTGLLTSDPLMGFRTLALAAISLGTALGLRAIVMSILRSRLPFARSTSVLLVLFQVILTVLASEQADASTDRSTHYTADAWTTSGLTRLEPFSAVLIQSPSILFRLWAAQVVNGERPDVLVVPEPLLGRGRMATNLLATEPAIEPLLRDIALRGEASESALSTLADARRLHVELETTWSKRMARHLNVDGLWLEYAPQPLGPSDRKMGISASLKEIERVVGELNNSSSLDTSTARVLATTLTAQASTLTMLGEHQAADEFLTAIDKLEMPASWIKMKAFSVRKKPTGSMGLEPIR